MKTKAVIFFLMLFSFVQAQNNTWLVYNQGNSSLPSNYVKVINFDGAVTWIGTIQGLAVIKDNQWNVYNPSNSDLQSDYIQCVSVDNTGTKWIGTLNGVVSVDNSPSQRGWDVYNTSNSGLPLNNVTDIAVDSYNRKWIATWGGGLAMFDGSTWITYDMYNSGLPVNGIYRLKIDGNDNVWIATHGGGLIKFDGVNWQVYNSSNSNLPSNLVYDIDIDLHSNIWLGTELGLVKFDGNNQWRLYNTENTGWDFTAVMCVKADKLRQILYFGTYNGMGIYENDTFTFKKTNNSGLSNNWVSAINIDDNGNRNRCFGGCHRNDKYGKKHSFHMPGVEQFIEGNKVDTNRIEDQLQRHQHGNQIFPDKEPIHSYKEHDGCYYQEPG